MPLPNHLTKTFKIDKEYLEKTKLPIITVSASYKEDLKGFHGLPEDETLNDIVFSRAHYSMALAAAVQAWGKKLDPAKAWIADPTNYVQNKDWQSITLTETIGKTIARHPLLKTLKDFIDKFGRSKLPILGSITPPLLHLTQDIKSPILSFHIASGNILASQGKKIVQVITDPHVREEYLLHANNPKVIFCVFDKKTQTEFLEKATILGIKADPKRVIVTGPPVDPRVVKASSYKKPWKKGPVNLCLTTGGLGTNKQELHQLLRQLLPELRRRPTPYNICLYAGTHRDIFDMAKNLAQAEHIKPKIVTELTNSEAFPSREKSLLAKSKFSIIYHPQIVDANELLVTQAFPWADGFIGKPSGDMAYDAVAAGCFLLTLKEWGEWEYNIREFFEQKGVARKAEVKHIVKQLQALSSSKGQDKSWIESAMKNAQDIEESFWEGVKNINGVVGNF